VEFAVAIKKLENVAGFDLAERDALHDSGD
jgi:hypothetical protein